jgi:DNA-binding transcriptional LysR family regulator
MSMRGIEKSNGKGIDLRHLRVLDVLFQEGTLTRAAQVLGVTQPALSKTLASLRAYFGDPLFIRVGQRMEPTSKALELRSSVRTILDQFKTLRTRHVPFDPQTSARVFSFCVVDAGIIRLVPRLIELFGREAPNVGLRVRPIDIERLEPSLESGQLDFAMGSFPSLSKKIRRQRLWSVSYVSVVRKDHPRIRAKLTADAFAAEKHVLVSASGTGHAHQQVERVIEDAVPAENIVCRVPTFVTATLLASMSDAVVTVPSSMSDALAQRLNLRVLEPPVKVRKVDVSQYWHERFHREAGSIWIREVFAGLFSETSGARSGTP